MATIQKRSGKKGTSYRALIRVAGVPPISATFKSRTRAKQWAGTTEAALREGRHLNTSEAKKTCVASLIDDHLETVLPLRNLSSARDQRRHLRYWKEQIGRFAVSRVGPDLIAREKYRLANKVGPATVNRSLASLSAVFRWAVRERKLLDRNPLRSVDKLPEPDGRKRFLSDDERGRLLEACLDSSEPRLYPLVVLALSTGARRGELLNLKWSDVDLEREIATFYYTKNQDTRSVPLSAVALDQLRSLGRVRRLDSDLVLANRQGKASYPKKAWERALKAAQIEDFRFHDLRHSAASYLAMSGATLAELAEILGHKTLAMVKRYSHLTEQHTSKVVARMNEQFIGNGAS